jgi:hypothetical protein
LNQGERVVITTTPGARKLVSASPEPAKAAIRSTLGDQHATIKELERRLAQSTLELAERENRIAELTRKNERLSQVRDIRQDITQAPANGKPKAKSKGKRSSSPRTESQERDRGNFFSPVVQKDELEDDEIDFAIRQYLLERPEAQIELTKLRRGWYMVKPLGKKVFLKTAGKEKLVVRVGGGHVSFEKFIDDFTPGGAFDDRLVEASMAG